MQRLVIETAFSCFLFQNLIRTVCRPYFLAEFCLGSDPNVRKHVASVVRTFIHHAFFVVIFSIHALSEQVCRRSKDGREPYGKDTRLSARRKSRQALLKCLLLQILVLTQWRSIRRKRYPEQALRQATGSLRHRRQCTRTEAQRRSRASFRSKLPLAATGLFANQLCALNIEEARREGIRVLRFGRAPPPSASLRFCWSF